MDLSELVIKLTLDKDEAEQDAEEASSGIGEKIKSGLGAVGKAAGVAIAAVGTAAVAIGKQSIEAYSEFEQLTGGIETLYGSSASAVEKMLANADDAWKTAGMSANEYMSTAIEGSAALINSLGGDADKAAELMDMSIQDMADNVNKMGTSMESIQNAYRGFSRGNFTMLDNLALGFAGTKEGMQQLLDKAQEISGIEYDISSYADIVEAIHVVQTEMGITGTTAEEASKTIQGSMSAAKAAWQNMLIGIADEDADFDKLVDDLVTSLETAAENLVPRIQTALDGAIKVIVPLVEQLLPVIIDTITENLPMIIDGGIQVLMALVTGIIQALPQLVEALPEIFTAIVTAFQDNWPAMKEAGAALLNMIWEGIQSGISALSEGVQKIWDDIKLTVTTSWDNIKNAVVLKIEALKSSISTKFNNIKQSISDKINLIKGLFNFDWSFPHLKLPHITYTLIHVPILGDIPDPRTLKVEWYRKAYENPYMFTQPTVMGFGDGVGGEIVYGHQNLLNDIRTAMRDVFGQQGDINIVVQSVLDGKVIGESVTRYQRQQARAFG